MFHEESHVMLGSLFFLGVDCFDLHKSGNQLYLISQAIEVVKEKRVDFRVFLQDWRLVNSRLFLADQAFQLKLEDEIYELLLFLRERVGCRNLLDHIVVLTDNDRDFILPSPSLFSRVVVIAIQTFILRRSQTLSFVWLSLLLSLCYFLLFPLHIWVLFLIRSNLVLIALERIHLPSFTFPRSHLVLPHEVGNVLK